MVKRGSRTCGHAGGQGLIHLQHDEYEVWNRQCLAQSPRSRLPEHHEAGGFFKQADMEQGLLFAIRTLGFEERWRAQGHDISEMSFKICVMLSHLRQKKGFKATANTCKKSVERASRPHPFLAQGSAKLGT